MSKSATTMAPVDELLAMLTYCRPHESRSEHKFINRFLRPIPGVLEDGFGNLYMAIGNRPRVLWSAHTDSVHRMPGRQAVWADQSGIIKLVAGSDSNCLGGDNAVGCWLLRHMALAGVPGLYVWHRSEERGCQGSNWILTHRAGMLYGIEFAIAFDRRGYDSIVTHQMGGRLCSDAFATQLAQLLGLGHRLDSTGMFTDTATYSYDIPECTNVSAGANHEHTAAETVDSAFALEMLDAVLAADFSSLRACRDPSVDDYLYPMRGGDKLLSWDDYFDRHKKPATMVDLISDHPYEIAALLGDLGMSVEQLEDYLLTEHRGSNDHLR